jgi:hypothetical protein
LGGNKKATSVFGMDKIKRLYKEVNGSNSLEWICRLIITFDLLQIMYNVPTHSYLDFVVICLVAGIWLYFFKTKLAALSFFY